ASSQNQLLPSKSSPWFAGFSSSAIRRSSSAGMPSVAMSCPLSFVGALLRAVLLPLEHLAFGVGEPPEVLVRRLWIDHHELGVLELVEAVRPELPTGPGERAPAERQRVVVQEGRVDPEDAGLDLAHRAERLVHVERVEIGAEPVARAVGERDRLVEALHPAD